MKAVEIALNTVLSDDATLVELASAGVWNPLAPEGVNPPYVVFQKSSGTPDYTFKPAHGSGLSSTSLLYIVKGLTEGMTRDAGLDIAAAIDTLLIDNALDGYALDGGGHIVNCRKQTDLDYPEIDNPGRYLRHIGGVYRIDVVPA